MSRRFQVQVVEEGFFWPGADLAVETQTEQGFAVIPVADLTDAVQFFLVRAEQHEFLLVDAGSAEQRALLSAVSAERFATARCAFIVELRDGYARMQLDPCDDPLQLAAAIATVAFSAAWDESEVFVTDIGESRRAVHIEFDEDAHWATERTVR